MNTTEVVAIVTGASTLLAGGGTTALTSYLSQRSARHLARTRAYERLATAAHTTAFRAAAIRAKASTTQADLNAAFEDVVAATGVVHIRGSQAASDKAEALLDACSEFANLSLTANPVTAAKLEAATHGVLDARRTFLELARSEEQSRRLPR
jgi:hypothetical protein